MKITCSEKIRLYPTKQQDRLLRQAVGHARFAYNWALARWKEQYLAGEKPNSLALRRELNAVKREKFPWMLDVPKRVVQEAIINLGKAFDKFFKKQGNYPKFKKKKDKQRARFDNGAGTFEIEGDKIRLPKVGWIKIAHPMHRSGKLLSATISLVAGNIWHVAVCLETEIDPIARENQAVVGVDLGVRAAATLSNGEIFQSPNPLRNRLRKLRRMSRVHSRKKYGSNNRRKSAIKLARLYWRMANIRSDFIHKLTSRIVKDYSTIAIEDLNVRGMLANDKLSRAISDIGFYEIRRQLEYKAKWYGSEIVLVDRFFPSSKTCSTCGAINDNLKLKDRIWSCDCGASHDRDVNAAINLQRYALRRVAPEVTPAESVGR